MAINFTIPATRITYGLIVSIGLKHIMLMGVHHKGDARWTYLRDGLKVQTMDGRHMDYAA